MSVIYCLDSGVFINSWTKHYPIDLFPSFWKHLDILCRTNQVFVPPDVAEEVYVGGDGVSKWLKDRKKVVAKQTEDIAFQMSEIVNKYPRLTAMGSGRSAADPWVVSYAFNRQAILVTEEQPTGSLAKPKIPDVCQDLRIQCTNTVGLLRKTGFLSELGRLPQGLPAGT